MIDFMPSDEQQALVELVRKLMDRHATEEYISRLDREGAYPYELWQEWAAAGLLGLPFPEEYGGQGGSVMDFILVAEVMGYWGYDMIGVYGTPLFMGLNVLHHGTEQQRERWLSPLLRGERRFSVAMTEPGAGSDAGAMRTTAVHDGGVWRLNGEKVYASGAGVENTTVCLYARTAPGGRHQEGTTCFLVPNDTPGLQIRPIETLGRHLYPTTQILLADVEIPADQVLGAVNGGWDVLLSGLQLERLATSAAYVGNARAVVDYAVDYAKNRVQFGKRIGDFQAISHMLADMHTVVEAARVLMLRAAWAYERGGDALIDISMAKLFGSETFMDVANKGMQILGGYGYSMEFPMQRHFRAARGATITAGTSQMQRQLIARKLGFKPT
ncbi:acyl-CoA dehydrogenase family protein [Mycobacterium paraintracellulare]|uniref:acyl-CoA dehydrogenase family protein n=1 Tax=Mycobacterium paraintracellulare TaxID=1138383 RepID=UPI00192928A0|nr:acyl-CoA dehydrogenase family protein [Mycobacterium paraintracellulare]